MPPLTPLVRPDRYFATRELDGLRVLAVVGGATIALVAVFYGIGGIVAVHIDGTVMVDNPERPPTGFCDVNPDQAECDQPRKVERNVDTQIWAAWNDSVWQFAVGVPFAWLLIGVLLHAGSWLAGGEHGVFSSFAVAAWGLAPMLASGIVALVVLYVAFDPLTVTPATQETALETAKTPFRALDPIQPILSLVTAAWSTVIWRYGLEYRRGLSGPGAWLVAGGVAAFLGVTTLV